jgi:hypothetical protein
LKGDMTSKAVMGLGVGASALGRLIGGRVGAMILGFGLAHIFLGALDRWRPNVRF